MPRKKKPKKITIEQMKSHIRDNLDQSHDKTISRIYEMMTGITAAQKMEDGGIRLIT